jgi:hypothetical protein
MRRFRALPLAEKIKAVEEMERLAKALAEAVERHSLSLRNSHPPQDSWTYRTRPISQDHARMTVSGPD